MRSYHLTSLPLSFLLRMKMNLIFIALTILILFPTSAFCETWTGNINLLFGQKELEKDDWEPLEEQTEIGIALDFKEKSWPVSFAVEFLHSQDDENESFNIPGVGTVRAKLDGSTTEFAVGLRWIIEANSVVNFFISGGLAYINAELEIDIDDYSDSEDDSAFGYWCGAGLYFTLAKHFNVGAQVRYSDAEVEIYDIDGEAGGTHLLLFAGYHW